MAGVVGTLIEVEADISAGLPGLTFTGLPDKSVLESRDRIRAALQNSGCKWPDQRITVALLPADVRKFGSRFDLALALAVLAAAGNLPKARHVFAETVWIAELGLDGALRPVRGVLPAVLAAAAAGATRVVVAAQNVAEAALVRSVEVCGANRLGEVIEWLRGTASLPLIDVPAELPEFGDSLDLADVAGQGAARRALEIAAAGAHHLSFQGCPGAGKTMLARRLPGILPPLNDDDALDVTAVHSVAGTLPAGSPLIRRPPFQAPHHSSSIAALVGGGTGLARPGAISLAHRGVLFLDEVAEMASSVLDSLRQPLESGNVVLHRSGGAVTYPARFILVMAANPCACGSSRGRDCTCTPAARLRYRHRLSGPLLDRVDLHVTVHPVARADLLSEQEGECSAAVADRVREARSAAADRWSGEGWTVNGDVPGPLLRRRRWRPPPAALTPADRALEQGQLSARGFDRVLRIAWTLADLSGRTVPGIGEVSEAVGYRTGKVEGWAA